MEKEEEKNTTEETCLKKCLEDNGYTVHYKIGENEVWRKQRTTRTIVRHPIIGLRNFYHDNVTQKTIEEYLSKNDVAIKNIFN